MNLFHRLHAFGDFAERGESLLIQECVVAEIYEELRGARVGAGGGEGDGAGAIGFFDGIIFEVGGSPGVIHFGMRAEAELDDEAGNYAEKSGAVEVAVLYEIVKAVGT